MEAILAIMILVRFFCWIDSKSKKSKISAKKESSPSITKSRLSTIHPTQTYSGFSSGYDKTRNVHWTRHDTLEIEETNP